MVVPFSEIKDTKEEQNWKESKEQRKFDLRHDRMKYLWDIQAEKAGGIEVQRTTVHKRDLPWEKKNWECSNINKMLRGRGAESFPRGGPALLNPFREATLQTLWEDWQL